MSEPAARIYDVGYRSYDGERRRPRWAVVTIALHAVQRVLGLRRSFRHKILPGLAIVIAFLPAIVSLVLAVVLEERLDVGDDLVTYGDYYGFVIGAIALFAAFVAPEALCTDRRTGMLGMYLAGPLDRGRYLLAKAAAVTGVMLLMTLAPPLLLMSAYAVEGLGPGASGLPALALRILATGLALAALFAAVGLGVASLTTRKAVAGVAVVLLVLVPGIVAEVLIDSGGAPDAVSVVGLLPLAGELALRVFDEPPSEGSGIGDVSTTVVVGGVLAWTALGAAVTWLSYRRIEARS
jgi:ABC-2 type transport system permease protein